MEVSLYQAAAAMNATERWQELVSENLAASSLPGARKQEMSFSAVQAGMASDATGAGFVLPAASPVTNFQQGEMHPSGNNMDAAVDGPGFFSLQMPNGETAYTRNGQFQISAKGQLVNGHGWPVLGQNGPVQISPSSPFSISATGEISQGGLPKGKMQIAEFNKPGLLTPISGNIFRADDPALVKNTDTITTNVRQGFLENANSSPTTEMASLVTAMRMFESNQKVLQMQSDRMSREITDLTSTN
jgi:flagellar basal body rod protein FlgG